MTNQAAASLPTTSKSARTRARLIDCAISVFSRKGVDSAAISEIAQEADLANGTFYIYFRDKAEIVGAVVDHIMTELLSRINLMVDPTWNAAEHLSFATREFIVQATHEREWGFTMFRSLASVPELRNTASNYFLPLVEEGIATGEFNIKADTFLGNTFATMSMLAVFSCLHENETPQSAGTRVAEYQLRILGLALSDAAKLAARSMGVSELQG